MVVASHCEGGSLNFDISGWFPIQGVQLGIFMFCSGYLYKEDNSKHVLKYIFKKIKSLIIPLYLYNFAYGVLITYLHTKGFTFGKDINFYSLIISPWIYGDDFILNLGGWFIAPLFIILVLNVLINKATKNHLPQWIMFLISVILTMIGSFLVINEYKPNAWLLLDRVLYFLPFFYFGRLYKTNLENIDKRIPNVSYFSALFVLQLIIIWKYKGPFVMGPSYFTCNVANYNIWTPMIVGLIGIAFWLRVSNILVDSIGKNKLINLIANNTYSIMINQFLGFMLVKTIYYYITKFMNTGHFNVDNFKSNIYYYYNPYGLKYFNILYLLAGIFVSILIQLCINRIIKYSKILWNKIRKPND